MMIFTKWKQNVIDNNLYTKFKLQDQNEKRDKFCWECGEIETSLRCAMCPRSFHSECIVNVPGPITDLPHWYCLVCKKLQSSKNK